MGRFLECSTLHDSVTVIPAVEAILRKLRASIWAMGDEWQQYRDVVGLGGQIETLPIFRIASS
ncbi:MAG: hypothetical protein ABTD50_21655 [Polyangiaceae bacterium]